MAGNDEVCDRVVTAMSGREPEVNATAKELRQSAGFAGGANGEGVRELRNYILDKPTLN